MSSTLTDGNGEGPLIGLPRRLANRNRILTLRRLSRLPTDGNSIGALIRLSRLIPDSNRICALQKIACQLANRNRVRPLVGLPRISPDTDLACADCPSGRVPEQIITESGTCHREQCSRGTRDALWSRRPTKRASGSSHITKPRGPSCTRGSCRPRGSLNARRSSCRAKRVAVADLKCGGVVIQRFRQCVGDHTADGCGVKCATDRRIQSNTSGVQNDTVGVLVSSAGAVTNRNSERTLGSLTGADADGNRGGSLTGVTRILSECESACALDIVARVVSDCHCACILDVVSGEIADGNRRSPLRSVTCRQTDGNRFPQLTCESGRISDGNCIIRLIVKSRLVSEGNGREPLGIRPCALTNCNGCSALIN